MTVYRKSKLKGSLETVIQLDQIQTAFFTAKFMHSFGFPSKHNQQSSHVATKALMH
jgi:hypothetical protein